MPKLQEAEKPVLSANYSQEELQQILLDEKKYVQAIPFDLIDSGYMHIKTKAGELIPLNLNAPQQTLYSRICKLREQKKPIRMWILKFRQGGISTEVESILYSLTSQQENRNSLIMADEDDKSDYLFEMTKLYHEKLEEHQPHLAPKKKKSNEKKLEFQKIHSQIIIATGRNVDAARAYTYQYVHLSEVAFFPHLGDVLDGLMQSIPDHWDTIVIGETTANGVDNEFYTEWQKAKKGESDWIPVFLGWYIMPDYSRPLGTGGQLESLTGIQYDTDGGQEDFLKEEELLQRKYNLNNEQLNWRRWCIKNKCRGQVRVFRAEYPSDDDEAFITSGHCVFDTMKLKQQKLSASVKAVGELYEDRNGKVVFRKTADGNFRILQDIGKDIQVVIGADIAEGVGQAESAACALDKRTNNTVMGYVGDVDPDQFAADLKLMGRYCNNALIAPENNSLGYSVCSDLYKSYPKVYAEKRKDGKVKVGWATDSKSRPQMISQLIREIREDATELRDETLISQCLTFVRGPSGKIEAQKGKQDDYVMARMIAGRLREMFPYTHIEPRKARQHAEIERRKQKERIDMGLQYA